MEQKSSLCKKTVILGVSGGIAAYKACDLTRLLKKAGADVHVVLTKAAAQFVTPLTLQTLSGNPVHQEMFDKIPPNPPFPKGGVDHISLADRADAILIAPATANIIAKVSHGICDDLLTTVVCATKAPVIFAPSMNSNMWSNPITQENVTKLRDLKYRFIEPEEGELACGYEGKGRLPDIEKIVEKLSNVIKG